MPSWSGRMDYVFFAYGLSFLILSLVSYYLHTIERDQPRNMPWLWLWLFGLAHGLHEWLETVVLYRPGGRLFVEGSLLLMALSCLFLLEFGRRLTPRLRGRKAAFWLYGLLMFLALSGLPGGLKATNASVRYFLALPAGLLSSWALLGESKHRPAAGRQPFLLLSVAFLLYGFCAGIVVPKSDFALAGLINNQSFLQLLGIPVQVVRGLLGLVMAVLICVHSLEATRLGRSAVFGLAPVGLAVAAIVSGWFFTDYLGEKAARELEGHARANALAVVERIDEALQVVDGAAAVAGTDPAVVSALTTRTGRGVDDANGSLDRLQRGLGLSVVSLMNDQGATVASSNRGAPGSFVGESAAFRPYYKEAIAGKPGRYFAVGRTSDERGYYGSHPVVDARGSILGVVVARKNIAFLEEEFRRHAETFLVSPEGVIFLSGRKDLLNRVLWPVGGARRAELTASRQFGTVSFEPLLQDEPVGGSYQNLAGKGVYLLRWRIPVGGWSVVSMSETVPVAISRALGIIVTLVFSLVIMSSFVILMFSENSLRKSFAMLELRRQHEGVLNEQLRMQQFLSEGNRVLQRPEATSAVLQQVAEVVVRYLDAAFARIWTLNPGTNLLELQASAGLYTHLDGAHARIPVGQYKIGLIAQEGLPVLTNAVIGDQRVHDQEWARREGMRAFAGYPLQAEGRVIGVLALFARQPLQETALEALGLLADRMASYFERKRAEEALQRAKDELEEKVRERTADLAQEIEVRKGTEAALVKSEMQLKEAQKLARIGSWDWNPRTGALQWSDEAYALFGVERAAFTPTYEAFLGFVRPADRDKVDKAVRATLAQRTPYHVEAGIVNSDGRTWIMEAFGSASFDDSGTPVRLAGTIQDITERKKVEEERLGIERLIQSQKYESLGTLSGGIAHQFNNLMNVVQLNLGLALLDAGLSASVRSRIQEAIQATDRTAELTRQILSFSGKGRYYAERIDLSGYIREQQVALLAGVPKTIRLTLHLADNLPPVEADALLVQQATVNLLINAVEAIEHKLQAGGGAEETGSIALSTGVMDCDEEQLRYNRLEEPVPPGRFVYLEVSDTGCGMDDETKRRLFDPFFSTKFTGRGLGMPAVLGVVRSHKGAIFIDSRPGQGATVRLLFPAAAADSSAAKR